MKFKRFQLKRIMMSLPPDGCILLFGVRSDSSVRNYCHPYGLSAHKLYEPFDGVIRRASANYYIVEGENDHDAVFTRQVHSTKE